MAAENVEVVRRVIAAFGERDRDTAARFLHPEVEWEPAGPGGVERTVYRGLEEIAQARDALSEVWDTMRLEEVDIRDLGDSVLWLGRIHLRGSGSDVELDQEFAQLFLVEDGRVARSKAFLTWRDGLEAAGLPPMSGDS
jgi:ketosteroid isomerase-like protein